MEYAKMQNNARNTAQQIYAQFKANHVHVEKYKTNEGGRWVTVNKGGEDGKGNPIFIKGDGTVRKPDPSRRATTAPPRKRNRPDKDQIRMDGSRNSVAGKNQGRLSQKPAMKRPQPQAADISFDFGSDYEQKKQDAKNKYWKPKSTLDKEIAETIGSDKREDIQGVKQALDTVYEMEKERVKGHNDRYRMVANLIGAARARGFTAAGKNLDLGESRKGEMATDSVMRNLPDGFLTPGQEEKELSELLSASTIKPKLKSQLVGEAVEYWERSKKQSEFKPIPTKKPAKPIGAFGDDAFTLRKNEAAIDRYAFQESKVKRDSGGRFSHTSGVGSVVNAKHRNGDPVSFKITKEHGDKVNGKVTVSNGFMTSTVPRESLHQFHSDVTGDYSYLKEYGESKSPQVRKVINGEAKYLGKGADGVVHDTGDGFVVKSSTTVPFHPVGQGEHATPNDALEAFEKKIQTEKDMFAAGIPGILETKNGYVGDKLFSVRKKLDTKSKLSLDQLKEVEKSVKAAHEKGYSFNDEIQVGLDENGKPWHFDVGQASSGAHQFDKEDDEGHLNRLFKSHGFEREKEEADYDDVQAGIEGINSGSSQEEINKVKEMIESNKRDTIVYDHFKQELEKATQKFSVSRYAFDESKHPRDDGGRFAESDRKEPKKDVKEFGRARMKLRTAIQQAKDAYDDSDPRYAKYKDTHFKQLDKISSDFLKDYQEKGFEYANNIMNANLDSMSAPLASKFDAWKQSGGPGPKTHQMAGDAAFIASQLKSDQPKKDAQNALFGKGKFIPKKYDDKDAAELGVDISHQKESQASLFETGKEPKPMKPKKNTAGNLPGQQSLFAAYYENLIERAKYGLDNSDWTIDRFARQLGLFGDASKDTGATKSQPRLFDTFTGQATTKTTTKRAASRESKPSTPQKKKDGGWITIHGTHVFIDKKGQISKGPDHFVGKKPSEINKDTKYKLPPKKEEPKKPEPAKKPQHDEENDEAKAQISSQAAAQISRTPHLTNRGQVEQQAKNYWSARLSKRDQGRFNDQDEFAKQTGDRWETQQNAEKTGAKQRAQSPVNRDVESLVKHNMKEPGGGATLRGVTPEQVNGLLGGNATVIDAGKEFRDNVAKLKKQYGVKDGVIEEAVKNHLATGSKGFEHSEFHTFTNNAWKPILDKINNENGNVIAHGLDEVAKQFPIDPHDIKGLKFRDYHDGESKYLLSDTIEPPMGKKAVGEAANSDQPELKSDGPKDGDRNADGLVFKNGRWRREADIKAAESANERVNASKEIEQKNAMEHRWNSLMSGGHEKAIDGMSKDEAAKHLERLNAVPGNNPDAKKALESVVGDKQPIEAKFNEAKEAAKEKLKGGKDDEAVAKAKKAPQNHDSKNYIEHITGSGTAPARYHDTANRLVDGVTPNSSLSAVINKMTDKSIMEKVKADPNLQREYKSDWQDMTEAAGILRTELSQQSGNSEFMKQAKKVKGQNAIGLIAAIADNRFVKDTMGRKSEFSLVEDFAGYAKDWNATRKQMPFEAKKNEPSDSDLKDYLSKNDSGYTTLGEFKSALKEHGGNKERALEAAQAKELDEAYKGNEGESPTDGYAKKDDGPKDGDKNADGLVFRNGRWRRELNEREKDRFNELDTKRNALQKQIEKVSGFKGKSDSARAGEHFHLGVLDRGKKASRAETKRRESDLNKTIDNAKKHVELSQEISRIENQMQSVENGKFEKAAKETDANREKKAKRVPQGKDHTRKVGENIRSTGQHTFQDGTKMKMISNMKDPKNPTSIASFKDSDGNTSHVEINEFPGTAAAVKAAQKAAKDYAAGKLTPMTKEHARIHDEINEITQGMWEEGVTDLDRRGMESKRSSLYEKLEPAKTSEGLGDTGKEEPEQPKETPKQSKAEREYDKVLRKKIDFIKGMGANSRGNQVANQRRILDMDRKIDRLRDQIKQEKGKESIEKTFDDAKAKAKEQAKADDGPKDGDRNEKGLVFRNGRWRREDKDQKSAPQSAQAPKPDAQKTPTSFDAEKHGGYKPILEFAKKTAAGEVSIDELKEMHKFMHGHQDEFLADLNKRYNAKQMKNISSNFGNWHAGTNKKGENAKHIYDALMDHAFDISPSDARVESYTMEEMRDKDHKANRLKKNVEGLKQEDLDKYVEYRKDKMETHKAAKAAQEKAESNPETLAEFKAYTKKHGKEKLSRKQVEAMDKLSAEKTRGERKEVEDQKKTVSAIDTTNETPGEFKLTKNYHSKRETDIFTASPENRVDKDKYREMNAKAKQLGGWYYKAFRGTPGGFHFPDEESRGKFLKLFGGEDIDNSEKVEQRKAEKTGKTTSKLHDLADRIEERANNQLNADRKTNTARRAGMAAHAEARARGELAKANTLRNIGQAINEGKANHLAKVSNGKHVDALDSELRMASWNHIRNEHKDKNYKEQEEIRLNGNPADHIHNAEFPHPHFHANDLHEAAAAMKGKRGVSYDRQTLINAANNLNAKSDGHGVISNKHVQESVQAAIDKLKTYRDPTSKRIVERLKDAGERQNRLKSMGIHDEHELREALREYVPIKGKEEKADPVKTAERKLIGKKLPGFFPTPPSVIEKALESAGIQDGHDVLEPSAGAGHIMDAIRSSHPNAKLKGLEMNRTLDEVLGAKDHNVEFGDFKEHKGSYDRIVMNPPFEKNQDADHVQHAFKQLKPGGRVVAIVSGGGGAKRAEFDKWIESQGGTVEDLPAGSFSGSDAFRQTGVNSRLVTIDKDGGSDKYKANTLEYHRERFNIREFYNDRLNQFKQNARITA